MTIKPTIALLLTRMRSDIRLAIITLYSISSVVLIMPFALYRLYSGEIILGLAELAIIGLFVALTMMAWMSRKTQLAADLTACAASAGTIALVLLMDISVFWTFSTLVGNFLMARKHLAVLLSIVVALSIGVQPDAFPATSERMSYLAVAALASLFSLIFAAQVDLRHGQLSNMLLLDPLTGALNRRALDLDLQAIAQSHNESANCLVMMDLDEFKRLNDVHGHDAGDRVLIALTEIIKSRTREKDRFYRYGGEEFVLLFPLTSFSGAETATEHLRQALLHELQGPGGLVTVSMGLAQGRPGETPEDWLKRADGALLEAKRTGRNKVVSAS